MLVRTVRGDIAIVVDLNGGNSRLGIALGQSLLKECFINSDQVILVVSKFLQFGQLKTRKEMEQ